MSNKIRYTQPSCFNDPFELFPVIEGSFTNDQFEILLDSVTQPHMIEYAMETTLKSGYDKLNLQQKSVLSYELYSAQMRSMMESIIDQKQLTVKELVKNKFTDGEYNISLMLNEEYLKLINSTIGILCLSKKWNDLLMWSHYCNLHTGIILKINCTNEYFESLDEVKYPNSNERPRIEISKQDYTQSESIDLYKKIFFNKSKEWSYEEEYRDYKPLNKGTDSKKEDSLEFPIFLYDLPPNVIEGVIFGVRVSDENINSFKKLVTAKYKNLSFEKASLNQERFEMDISEA